MNNLSTHELWVLQGMGEQAKLGQDKHNIITIGNLKTHMKISNFSNLIIYIHDKFLDEDESFSSTIHLLTKQKEKIELILINKEVEKQYDILNRLHNLLPNTRIELVNGVEDCKNRLTENNLESIGNYKIQEEKMNKEIIDESFNPFENLDNDTSDILSDLDNVLDGLLETPKPVEKKTVEPKIAAPKQKVKPAPVVNVDKANTDIAKNKVTNKTSVVDNANYKNWKPKSDKDIVLVYMPNMHMDKNYSDSLDQSAHLVYLDKYKNTEFIKTVDTMCLTNVLDETTFKNITSNSQKNVKQHTIQELFRVKHAVNKLDYELLIEKYRKFANKKTYLICNDESTFSNMIEYASNIELLIANNIEDTKHALELYSNFNSNNAVIKIYAGKTEMVKGDTTISVPVFTEMKK